MFKAITILLFLSFNLSACVKNQTPVDQGHYGLDEIMMFNNAVLIYTEGKQLISYQRDQNTFHVIHEIEGFEMQHKIDFESNDFFIYEYGENDFGKLINGHYDASSNEVKLRKEAFSNQELAYSDWNLNEVSHSGTKSAFTSEFGVGAHLQIKDYEKNTEGKVDYAISFDDVIWSPSDRFLAYTTDSYTGENTLNLFNVQEDDFGTETYGTDSYSFVTNSHSISQSIPKPNISKTPQIKIRMLHWNSDDTLLFNVYSSIWEEFNESSFWSYSPQIDSLTELAKIEAEKEWVVQSSIISSDLSEVAYIKTFSDKKVSTYEKTTIRQELWIANADGTDAKMIYKNY